MRTHPLSTISIVVLATLPARASGLAELKVKRQAVFEFAQKPAVTRDGDKVTITFTSKGYCDATVAIQDSSGAVASGNGNAAGGPRIIRHLASGVLGKNAPAPFRKDSLTQTIVWDGKDDQGKYVDDKEQYTVRVSLGLKARFERTLFWSPHKRPGDPKGIGMQPSLIAAAPEGVYVYEGMGHDHIRLFDHEGTYVRTVHPFPAGELAGVKNLKWHTFAPDGVRWPLKWGLTQHTLLTSGSLGYGKGWPTGGGGVAATTLAVHGGELYLVSQRLNKLAIAGAAGLTIGPRTGVPLRVKDAAGNQEFIRNFYVAPRSCAVSPGGQWLYLAGFNFNAYFRTHALHGVVRVALGKAGAEPELFAGLLRSGKQRGHGSDDAHFTMPASVACDAKGRVYVADWGNDRIQVFSPQAKLLKSIKTRRPSRIRIHPKTGELYVFSWPISCSAVRRQDTAIESTLTRLKSFEDPRVLSAHVLPVARQRLGVNTRRAEADVDFWTEPPTLWLARNKPVSYRNWPVGKMGILLLVEKNGKLVVQRDFLKQARRQVVRLRGPRHARQRLFVNPANGWLYVGEHHDPAAIHVKAITELIAINPATGKQRLVPIPFDAEDIAFDLNGLAYLRTLDTIARYDSENWREVPFDYGESRRKHGYHPIKWCDVTSVLTAVGVSNSSGQMYGMGVSPKGHIFAAFINPPDGKDRKSVKGIHSTTIRTYTPPIFPGRGGHVNVHVWDKHGKLVYEDAVPGLGRASGIHMDRDDNLYVLSAARFIRNGKAHFNDTTCTLIKVKPGQPKIFATKATIPLPERTRPKRPPDLAKGDVGRAWVTNAEWMCGGVGMDTKCLFSASRDCHCQGTSRFDLDYFARSFLPEIDRCSVLVLDRNGNPILRIGTYGNVDDGVPLVLEGGPARPRSVGGDEVALFWANHVATHTDRRLFIADPGNGRMLSVKLGYHSTEVIALKDIQEEK